MSGWVGKQRGAVSSSRCEVSCSTQAHTMIVKICFTFFPDIYILTVFAASIIAIDPGY